MAGEASHITGVVAAREQLTIRLTSPGPDFPSRIAQPVFCAVPSNTPIDPPGVALIPSAGPYYVTSYTPGQGVVLARNPNYHGSRPHRLRADRARRAESQLRGPFTKSRRATADFTSLGGDDYRRRPVRHARARLAARYGPRQRSRDHGGQQYFVNPPWRSTSSR